MVDRVGRHGFDRFMPPRAPTRAAPAKVVQPPALPEPLEPRVLPRLEAGAVIERCRLDACALTGTKAGSLRFEAVHVSGGRMDGSDLVNLTWTDVLCERCNLSMITWRGARLTRAVVRDCRVTGGKLVESALESVRFVDCHFDYASFADARLRQVVFQSCQLREVDFHGADLAGTVFVECELHGADFSRAKLAGADISASSAGGITVGPADVRGLVVNRAQASEMAKLFGLVVRD